MLPLRYILLEELLRFGSFPAWLSAVVGGRRRMDQSIGAQQSKFFGSASVLLGNNRAGALEAIFKEALRFLSWGLALVPTANSGRRL